MATLTTTQIDSAKKLNFFDFDRTSFQPYDRQALKSTSQEVTNTEAYWFTAVEGGVYDIYSYSGVEPDQLTLFDKDGNQVAIDTDGGGSRSDRILDFVATYTGEYYVVPGWIKGDSGATSSIQVYADLSQATASVEPSDWERGDTTDPEPTPDPDPTPDPTPDPGDGKGNPTTPDPDPEPDTGVTEHTGTDGIDFLDFEELLADTIITSDNDTPFDDVWLVSVPGVPGEEEEEEDDSSDGKSGSNSADEALDEASEESDTTEGETTEEEISYIVHTLTDIERINLSDTTIALDLEIDDSAGAAVLLMYLAQANGELPDAEDLGVWIAKADELYEDFVEEVPLIEELAGDMLDALAPTVSNTALIEHLLKAVTGAPATEEDVNFFLEVLDRGIFDQAGLVVYAAEVIYETGTYADLIGVSGIEYTPAAEG